MTPPTSAEYARHRKSRTRWLIVGAIISVLLTALYSVSTTLGRYEMSHDIPNLWWGIFNGSYSYTPEQGPPSPELMVTRPDTIIARYLSEYIDFAGTYPCVQNLARYDIPYDPVLNGGACDVKRPVVDYQITGVNVQRRGPQSGFKTTVSSVIHYADGTEYPHEFYMLADERDPYWLSFIHLNCWASPETLFFFDLVISDTPTGASYARGVRCKA